jgi:putative flippase GtrA
MGVEPGGAAASRSVTGLVRTWRDWLPAFLARTARYGAVGICMASFYSILVIVFHEKAGLDPDPASLLAFGIVLPFGYLGHWAITFQRRHRFLEGWQRFVVLNAISFTVAVPGMHLVTHVLGWTYLIGIAMAWVVSPAINYIVLQLWVFSHRRAL